MKIIDEVLELDSKATPGPWIQGDWYIYDKDRKAQQCGDPFWTIEKNKSGNCIAMGPDGRKSLKIDAVIGARCYETKGIYSNNIHNIELVCDYRTSAPKLARALKVAIEVLKELEKWQLIFQTQARLSWPPNAEQTVTKNISNPAKDALLIIEKELC